MQGTLKKLKASLTTPVEYHLPVGDQLIPLNSLIGKPFTISYTGNIFCSNCAKKTSKSYSQGHCFVCMRKLASCDMCIMKPETCHHAAGTCKEPQWGEENCMIPHYVYLANTSGLKVGITRHTQVPTRWIDQGATQALPIFKVQTRLQSGLVEVALAEFIADKTNWRTMLKGPGDAIDLKAAAAELIPQIKPKLDELAQLFGATAIEVLNEEVVDLAYPVNQYPKKLTSFNFDKDPNISAVLLGIKGQYLIFDTGVINIRKFTSYEVSVSF
ncbi:DUF2797 domain-containing protein [Pseudoalteromonas tunicata]|jgi:hypothetical protein|uniref:Uncharacterized protein n=1 Tax=Pseudoalteromonas tunicata D2 TaxID=87626 RepID=A4C791_9GAMM|nr:DUF2797 domain-containing protein [Pseudoalteromonas tunicata]ATC95815.1 hypothetical protein PTUN_a3499 [Pseudoalteromonas tunicata]AXT31361.1 DUF2797 domain-containing protein [Pseudoalteromonas tunicata]EAR29845.1 hypothetical protein PTD2_13534 [Pseudoalteromonas tunicata D2]MDP4984095.1 DUF2797 domain-containing protein [Pseudoalteromonas tunicata]MDP5214381.1 DUF2797 domain-containing protein [Pseudoalteromonas tunicata]